MKYYILVNSDGIENMASKRSGNAVFDVMRNFDNIELLELSKKKWSHCIEKINQEDICFLVTHGDFGEDGSLQKILEVRKISHTHSSAITCGILLNKHLTKLMYKSLGIKTPRWNFDGVMYGGEVGVSGWIQKPLFGGSKIGIKRVGGILNQKNRKNIFEEFIDGKVQISVGILGSGQNIKALPPLVRERELFASKKIKVIGSEANQEVLKTCESWAKKTHIALGCKGITKTDFLLDNKNVIWAIETDAIPGLSKDNAVVIAAGNAGISHSRLINYIIKDLYVE